MVQRFAAFLAALSLASCVTGPMDKAVSDIDRVLECRNYENEQICTCVRDEAVEQYLYNEELISLAELMAGNVPYDVLTRAMRAALAIEAGEDACGVPDEEDEDEESVPAKV